MAYHSWLADRARLVHARLGGTRVGCGELARALGVPRRALDDAADRVRRALPGRLLGGTEDCPAVARRVAREAPDRAAATLEVAEVICRHIFDVLGSGPVALGTTIDWHRDFKSGHRWPPGLLTSDSRYAPRAGADRKVPWELSRAQHLPVLAQAWLLSGEARFAAEAGAQVRSWLDANPPGLGVNWITTMEVAIRAVNWLWTAALLAGAPEIPVPVFTAWLAALLAHGRHIAANLEVRPDGATADGGWIVGRRGVRLTPLVREPDGAVLAVDAELATGWVSPRYGIRLRAPVLRWRWRGRLPLAARFAFFRP